MAFPRAFRGFQSESISRGKSHEVHKDERKESIFSVGQHFSQKPETWLPHQAQQDEPIDAGIHLPSATLGAGSLGGI